MFKTLLGSLIVHEKIKTTEAKAKEIKGMIDQIINLAKETRKEGKKVSAIRNLNNQIPSVAVKKITGEFLEKFSRRNSGYTRVIKLPQRQADSASVAVIEFVD